MGLEKYVDDLYEVAEKVVPISAALLGYWASKKLSVDTPLDIMGPAIYYILLLNYFKEKRKIRKSKNLLISDKNFEKTINDEYKSCIEKHPFISNISAIVGAPTIILSAKLVYLQSRGLEFTHLTKNIVPFYIMLGFAGWIWLNGITPLFKAKKDGANITYIFLTMYGRLFGSDNYNKRLSKQILKKEKKFISEKTYETLSWAHGYAGNISNFLYFLTLYNRAEFISNKNNNSYYNSVEHMVRGLYEIINKRDKRKVSIIKKVSHFNNTSLSEDLEIVEKNIQSIDDTGLTPIERILLKNYFSEILNAVGSNDINNINDEMARIILENNLISKYEVIGEGRNEFGMIDHPFLKKILGMKRGPEQTIEKEKKKTEFLRQYITEYIPKVSSTLEFNKRHYLLMSNIGDKTLYQLLSDSKNKNREKYLRRHVVTSATIQQVGMIGFNQGVITGEEIKINQEYIIKRLNEIFYKYMLKDHEHEIKERFIEYVIEASKPLNDSGIISMTSDGNWFNSLLNEYENLIRIDHESVGIMPTAIDAITSLEFADVKGVDDFVNDYGMLFLPKNASKATQNQFKIELQSAGVLRHLELMAYRKRDKLNRGIDVVNNPDAHHIKMALSHFERIDTQGKSLAYFREDLQKIVETSQSQSH